MVKVYFLPVLTQDTTHVVAGIDLIHHALLETTEQPMVRKLIMDTTPIEHDALKALAIEYRGATQEELDQYNSIDWPPPPEGFIPLNPSQGVEHRLTHVEAWLVAKFPPPPQD